MDLHLTLFLAVPLAFVQVRNLSVIYLKRLFRSETKFEGCASSTTVVFSVLFPEQTATVRQGVVEI